MHKGRRAKAVLSGVTLLFIASSAAADLIWRMEFDPLPPVITTTDIVVVSAKLINSTASTANLGVIGGFLGVPPGFDYEIGGFASIPNGYDHQFGPEFVGNVSGALSDQFEGVDLAPGESFDFVYAMMTPQNGEVPVAVYCYSAELQLFLSSAQRPMVGRSGDSICWQTEDITNIAIDIKPDSYPNCFNVNGHGVIPVAILGSETFDVTNIDQLSLSFGGLYVRVRGQRRPLCNIEYSDADAYLDLVCHFEDDAANWTAGSEYASLTGTLMDGSPFEGTDSICIVP